MLYKQMAVKITGNGLAAGCQVFYRKIYGFSYSAPAPFIYNKPFQGGTSVNVLHCYFIVSLPVVATWPALLLPALLSVTFLY